MTTIPRIVPGLELVDDSGYAVRVEDVSPQGVVTLILTEETTEDGDEDSYTISIRELRGSMRDGAFAVLDNSHGRADTMDLKQLSTKRILDELEERAQDQPGAWTANQAFRLMTLAERVNPTRVDNELGQLWWKNLTPEERADWLQRADSVLPSDAWRTFKRGLFERRAQGDGGDQGDR